jgi:hypothetical protein
MPFRRVGPKHAAHQLVRSGQRMPVPGKELGLGGEWGRRLPSEGTSDIAQVGHSRHMLLVGLRRPHGSAGYTVTIGARGGKKSLFYSTGRAMYLPALPFRLPGRISC